VRVLIVKLSALGDIVHALPVLDYLHRVKPGIEIDWVVEDAFRCLLEGNPLIAEIIPVKIKLWRKRPLVKETRTEFLNAVRRMRSRNYDLVFDIQGNIKSGITAWLSGCPDRLGFAREETQEAANTWLTTRHVPLKTADRHITDQYLRIVSTPFGRDFHEMDLVADIPTSADDDIWATEFIEELHDGLVFLFHCGTTWQTKFWHEAGWIELARCVKDSFSKVTMLFTCGNEAERSAAERIVHDVGACTRVVDRLALGRLVALVKKVDMVIGGDTGIVHMAAAVGTPTVSYYRASDGLRSGPRGKQHVIVQAPMPCASCFRTTCAQDEACRESIRADELLLGIKRVFSP
jgi:heptosyltransferase-1